MFICRLSLGLLLFSSFFFFKQKTAYEMRISDWSSDVCSSDLHRLEGDTKHIADPDEAVGPQAGGNEVQQRKARPRDHAHAHGERGEIAHAVDEAEAENEADMVLVQHIEGDVDAALRSEEHTSEHQSLMRLSYAVYCLKKKTYKEQT